MNIKLMALIFDEYQSDNPTKVLLLLSLANMANDDGVCSPSVKTLARHPRIGERQVRRYMAEFEESGLITRDNRYDENGQISNLYSLVIDRIISRSVGLSSTPSLSPDDTPRLTPMTGISLSPMTARTISSESSLETVTASSEDGTAVAVSPSDVSGKKTRPNR